MTTASAPPGDELESLKLERKEEKGTAAAAGEVSE